MHLTDGRYFTATLQALDLDPDQAKDAKKNASDILALVIGAYEKNIATDHVGPNQPENSPGFSPPKHLPKTVTGLVYGRIQSGKTRAMIASTAMSFDNGFRIVVVLTSNINDLVTQTHFDFAAGLPNAMVYTKDDELGGEVGNAKLFLRSGNGRLLIICSKGVNSIENVSAFLSKIDANRYPAIIFDDEGDQASLDTNTRKRSKSPIAVAPSSINKLIQDKLRPLLPFHVYVSVTGTPQAVLLQSVDSLNRPSFITLLPPGPSYIGGDHFFTTDEPEDNDRTLIRIVDRDEKNKLLAAQKPIPEGLRRAILFFLISSASLIVKDDRLPKHGKGYSFLCHPSLKNSEHSAAKNRINDYLQQIIATLLTTPGANKQVNSELLEEYEKLKVDSGGSLPPLDKLSKVIVQHLMTRKILVINARTKRQGIAYGPSLNFLIGGNTLGRGIAIKDLLVTYYIRDSRISQIDTMHQHARMFGYRQNTLTFTRLFIPRHLYYRFRDIHRSDQDLRRFIAKYKDDPSTFPIKFTFDLRTTRSGVLDVNTTDTIEPGKQVFPNFVIVPQGGKAYAAITEQLAGFFGVPFSAIDAKGKAGVTISAEEASKLVGLIRTKSENTWRDRTIRAVVQRVCQEFGGKVLLKYRGADRKVGENGFFSTGTLSGTEYQTAKTGDKPTLWVMSVKTAPGSSYDVGLNFMYPTFVVPESFPDLLMFNKK